MSRSVFMRITGGSGVTLITRVWRPRAIRLIRRLSQRSELGQWKGLARRFYEYNLNSPKWAESVGQADEGWR